MNLRDNAAAAANGGTKADDWPATPAVGADGGAVMTTGTLPDVDYSQNPIADADKVPVAVAWSRVMADVQSITKADRRDDVGGRYNFRGVDRVVNAVGPALRRHGVVVVPVRVFDVEYRETKTSKGTVMQECTLKVSWAVYGPDGDRLQDLLESAGQATDTQDKATSKATSVAHRVLFLTGLHIPTQDPDIEKGYDRGEQPRVNPNAYRDEIANPQTSAGRLRQIRKEINDFGIVNTLVVNENGDDEPLLKMLVRIGQERAAAEAGGDK